MDMSHTNDAKTALGNVGIPDWMLKRRARLKAQAGNQTAEVEPATTASESDGADQISVSEAAPTTADPIVVTVELKPPAPSIVPVHIPIKAEPISVLPSTTWFEDFRHRWLGWKEQKSFLISLAIHLICGACLSAVVFHPDLTNMGLSTIMSEQEGGEIGELDDSTFQIDTSGGQSSESLDSMLTARAVSSTVGPSLLDISELGGMKLGEGEGTGDQVGDGLNVGGFKMPAGGNVVRKGSFVAWTVPQDPKPYEDYKIIIQVTYKQKSQKLPRGDITGSVIGTDKYRLMISEYTSTIIPDANQVVVEIPGAASRVRDTIRVFSAILKENQRLEIVF